MIFDRLKAPNASAPAKSAAYDPAKSIGHPHEFLEALRIGRLTKAGEYVTPESAMKEAAFYGCVSLLSRTQASFPLSIQRLLKPEGREPATEHPLFRLLNHDPNTLQTSFEFVECMAWSRWVRGNAYALKILGLNGEVEELIPIHPDHIEIEIKPGRVLEYKVCAKDVTGSYAAKTFRADQILHVRGISSDGVAGRSTVADMAERLGLTQAQLGHAGATFRNGAQLAGVLEHPQTLSDGAAERIRKSFQEKYGGTDNAFKTAVLEEGMKWRQVSMTAQDAQLLQAIDASEAAIARFFGVPLALLQMETKSTSWGSGIAQLLTAWLVTGMGPEARRWEQRLEKDLGIDTDLFAVDFDETQLLWGDLKGRVEILHIMRTDGVLNGDEYRRRVGLNPMPDELGQTFLMPQNMGIAGEEPDPGPTGNDGQLPGGGGAPDRPDDASPEESDDE